MRRCNRCQWDDDPEERGSRAGRALRLAAHLQERHGVSLPAATLEQAERLLRAAKRRYGIPMDAGRES